MYFGPSRFPRKLASHGTDSLVRDFASSQADPGRRFPVQEMNTITLLLLCLLGVSASSGHVGKPELKWNSAEVVAVEVNRTEAGSHPTVKCEHIRVREEAEAATRGRRDGNEACFGHCVTLGSEYRGGKCVLGLCRCEREPLSRGNGDRVPTVKCADLVPDGGIAREDNSEACDVHCRSLGGAFREGKCIVGVCTCRMP